jgi:hypothetical protein
VETKRRRKNNIRADFNGGGIEDLSLVELYQNILHESFDGNCLLSDMG